ncbi:MAG: trigger factor [Atopostipes suicloacalis]|nr:trigger factor [Atopostipes suicloacalis]
MTAKFEKTGPVSGELTFSIEREVIEEGLDQTYNQIKGNLNIPGFRKGRVPRKLFNQRFGEESLYEDTLNDIFPAEFAKVSDSIEGEIVGQPSIKDISWDKGEDWELTVLLSLEPDVELGQYKDLDVTKQNRELEDDAVETELEKRRQEFTELVIKDSAAKDGDTVVIDYEGSVDGELFEGGSATNHSLKLGSNSFIPGFEEQLVGAEPDSEVEVKVSFPTDYQAEELAGKEAVFQVKVHEVKEEELPELDDDFAQDLDEDVESLDELRSKIQEELKTALESQADEARDEEAIKKAVDNAEIEEVPDEMIHEEVHRQLEMFYNNLKQNGMEKEMYFQITGTTEEDLHDQFEEGAEESVRTNLVLEKIVEEEELKATDDEQNEEIQNLSEQYNLSEEQVKEVLSPKLLTRDIAIKKAVDLITTTANEVLEAETEE